MTKLVPFQQKICMVSKALQALAPEPGKVAVKVGFQVSTAPPSVDFNIETSATKYSSNDKPWHRQKNWSSKKVKPYKPNRWNY